ncbi:MAG: DUF2378 family protein [Archangium sp.]|nr:DUF2378 family protein [Archangium sp.]
MAAAGAPAEEVIFSDAVEGLFLKGLGERVTPELREELKAVGLDLTRPLLPAYPRTVWNAAIPLAAAHAWPQLDIAEAHVLLGRTIIDGFKLTLLGKALAGMAKVLGPMRTLGRMRSNLRTGGNYNEVTLTPEGPTLVRFWINEPYLHPGYVKGLLQGSLEISGARNSTVDVVSVDDRGTLYRVAWDA